MALMTIERPQSEEEAAPRDDARRLAEVVRTLHGQIDPPEGWRVEIVEGKIVLSPTAFGKHAHIVARIRRAVMASLSAELEVYDNITLQEPETERYVPDLAVWPATLIDTETEWAFPGDECLLAVEVTSPDQGHRDYRKAAGYARAGVPVYLLVDRRERVSVVFTEPEAGRYRRTHEVPFGKPVTLPLNPPVTVETADF